MKVKIGDTFRLKRDEFQPTLEWKVLAFTRDTGGGYIHLQTTDGTRVDVLHRDNFLTALDNAEKLPENSITEIEI